ncbi:D-alanyl-D-alanine carboxypeptidase family protein [Paenibacillus sp. HJGM_3]|uniref:D-alanyl-D-alanine carboxypeptidase family protein n=1 Tax=Paenibacillus sp. HJGM_3 TaxID=3379816 RepID=UPI003865AF96
MSGRVNKSKVFGIIGSSVLSLSMLQVFLYAPEAQAAETVDLKLTAKAGIIMEASTGQVLWEMNADELLPPASMSKMMTEYIVMETIKSGKIKWEDVVTTSRYAADVIGSGDLLAFQEKSTVRDLFGAMSIYSGNDATVALAEFVAGSEDKFVEMMNATAKKMGLNPKAQFVNSTGLSRADLGKYQPANTTGETMMTARDAAILASHIVNEHKEILQFSSTPSKKFRESDKSPMINWNWMLEGNKDNINFRPYTYPGVDGLKTGHTDEAGYCFTGTAVKDGMRLITVVMNTPSEPQRFLDTRKLLDYGFNNYEIKPVLAAKSEVESMKVAKIKKGIKTEVPVVTESNVDFVVKKGEAPQIEVTAAGLDQMKAAPIKTGDVLGTATVKYAGMEKKVNLVASQDMEKGSWFRLFFRAIKNFFGDVFSGIASGLKNLF